MILSKTKYVGLPNYKNGEDLFAVVSGSNLRFSSAVRTRLAGFRSLYIDILPNGDFKLIPTNDVAAYKITKGTNNQLSISATGLCRTIRVPSRTRIPCEILVDGSLLIRAGGA